jgi:hypothetical protein
MKDDHRSTLTVDHRIHLRKLAKGVTVRGGLCAIVLQRPTFWRSVVLGRAGP